MRKNDSAHVPLPLRDSPTACHPHHALVPQGDCTISANVVVTIPWERSIHHQGGRVCFTGVPLRLDASCRHDLLHSFLLSEHFARRGGRLGFLQHRPFCTSRLISSGISGRSPTLSRHAELRTWFSTRILRCERSLCTQDKRLSRQRVCSTQFCSHAPLWECAANARSEANFILQTLHSQDLLKAAAIVLFIAALLSSADSKKCTDFTI